MRTTTGKPTLDRILLGDLPLAEAMAAALGVEEGEQRLTHGFHTYPAGLHADAARDLLALFPSRSLLDPFCGGGTVLVEGLVSGRRTVGNDLNPTALRVARARTARPSDAELTMFRSASRKLAEAARASREPPPDAILLPLQEWYADCALVELESLRRGVKASDPVIRPLLEAVFSSILVKVSWRESDTSAHRKKHHRPPGTTAVLFHKKARELARRLVALREATPPGTPPVALLRGDSRKLRLDAPVDLALTSPPYPGTYDYLPMQHLRRVWLGDGKSGEDDEVGSRRSWRDGSRKARSTWASDTNAWTRAVADALTPGGTLVVVVGDGLTPSGDIDTSEPTEEAARQAGLRAVARASLARPDHARGTQRWEHVFAFRKA